MEYKQHITSNIASGSRDSEYLQIRMYINDLSLKILVIKLETTRTRDAYALIENAYTHEKENKNSTGVEPQMQEQM